MALLEVNLLLTHGGLYFGQFVFWDNALHPLLFAKADLSGREYLHADWLFTESNTL